MAPREQYDSDPSIQIITGVCPHDCPDTCSWQVAVRKDAGAAAREHPARAIDIWGHADHPITQGRLCGKVDRYLERTYHPERLTTPRRRSGPKGSGQFQPISWAEAIDEIVCRVQQVTAEYSAESVLPYSYAGTMGFLQGEGMASRLWNRMGVSKLARTICSEAGFEGYLYTVGAGVGMDTPDYAHANLILLWGTNTLTSNQHLWPFISEARKQGARVIVIDPARTRTARAADEWIGINPGTDGALALAMMHVIVDEGLHDADYVAQYTAGFPALRERLSEWTPGRAAELTGVAPGRIRQLARDYATVKPAAIRINYGLQRHYGGGMAVRTIACLPALVGAWRRRGGGIQLSASGNFRHLDTTGLQRPDLLEGRRPRTINMNRLGDALSPDSARVAQAYYAPRPVDRKPAPGTATSRELPPVKALVVYNCNPAAVAPDQSAVLKGLAREDLFTVVLEHFQTDTADYADILLPATTQLEHWDILRPYGHLFLSLNRPAIEPVGKSLPNSEIFRRIAAGLGYKEACFRESDETILRNFVEEQSHPTFSTVTWERLLAQGFIRLDLPDPYLPFAQGNFPTASGKCEFYSQRMLQDGYDPLPTYTPPAAANVEQEGFLPNNHSDATNSQDNSGSPVCDGHHSLRYSLRCISPPAHSFLNSSFANLERFRQREERPYLQIHPVDASARGVEHGASVRVWNERGEVVLRAQVTEDIVAGTVLIPGIWWTKYSSDGRNVNQLTPQGETDMGASARFYDTRVFVAAYSQGLPEEVKNEDVINEEVT